jgi:ubiquinone/menaquinone biosynthesis C-methylase UbiE
VADQSNRDVGAPKPFAHYDRRNYATFEVAEAYARWAPTYDGVDDRVDIDLLAASPQLGKRIAGSRVIDLGCGTGRIGAWLVERGAREIVGVDLCVEMLERARARGIYASTVQASVVSTELPAGSFDGAISSLVLDHVADLGGFFAEAQRLLRPGGWLAIVDFHPFFMMQGIPTHFRDGEQQVAVVNHVHALRDFFQLAVAHSFNVVHFDERFVTDEWASAVPNYAKHVGLPVAHLWVYEAAGPVTTLR